MFFLYVYFLFFFFFFNDTATTEIYTSIDTLSLHDALPIRDEEAFASLGPSWDALVRAMPRRSEEHTSELQSPIDISYAVFCLKKKKIRCARPPPRRPREAHPARPAHRRAGGRRGSTRPPPPRRVRIFFLMLPRPPRSTRRLTLLPYTTLFRSLERLLKNEPSGASRAICASGSAPRDRKSTRLNSSHQSTSRMPSSA